MPPTTASFWYIPSDRLGSRKKTGSIFTSTRKFIHIKFPAAWDMGEAATCLMGPPRPFRVHLNVCPPCFPHSGHSYSKVPSWTIASQEPKTAFLNLLMCLLPSSEICKKKHLTLPHGPEHSSEPRVHHHLWNYTGD